MKKTIRAAIASLFVLAFAVVGMSSVMVANADLTADSFDIYDNLALNKTGFADSTTPQFGPYTPDLALDGKVGKEPDNTRWQTANEDKTADSWMGVDFGAATTVNTVVIEWENKITEASYWVEYCNDAVLEDTTIAHNNGTDVTFKTATSGTWNKVANADVQTGDKLSVITFDAVDARYIRVYIKADSALSEGCKSSTPSFFELSVYNIVEEPTVIGDGTVVLATSVVDGVKSVFVATNVAEADVPAGASIKASYTITVDGQTATGEKIITAAYTSITLGVETVTAADITGADAADYVTGILFNNVPQDATIEVVFTVAE